MIVIHCQQGTPEWWEHKRGKISASSMSRILTAGRITSAVSVEAIDKKGNRNVYVATCAACKWASEPGLLSGVEYAALVAQCPNCGATEYEYAELSAQSDGYIYELIADIACFNPKFFTNDGTAAMRNGRATEPEARRWYEMERGVDVEEVGCCMTDDERFLCSPDGLVGEDGGLEMKCPELKTQAQYVAENRLPPEYRAQVHGCLIVTGRKWWDFLSYAPGLKPLLIRVEPDHYTARLREALEEFWLRFVEKRNEIHPPTKEEAQIDAWKRWLRKCGDDLAEINKGLPLMASLPLEVKREAWRLSELHGKSRGWEFNQAAKVFEAQYKPEF